MMSLETVTGSVQAASIGCADAHGHLWIGPGVFGAPVLDDEPAAAGELADFAAAGGGLVLDCQPGACGRNGSILARLAASGTVAVVASTGFHLPKYYASGAGPWGQTREQAERIFRDEVCDGLLEAPGLKAGSIKTAWTGSGGPEVELMLAALSVARETGTGVTVHTEMGQHVEDLAVLIVDSGVPPGRVQLSHVDKRVDTTLHVELARTGFVLGYDTFLRPKYSPEKNVWPLLRFMLEEGLDRQIAIGLDIVDQTLWQVKGGPGLRAIPGILVPRLLSEGATEASVQAMSAGNICRVLAGEESQ